MPQYRRISVVCTMLAAGLLSAYQSLGWGHEGHHYVGEIGVKYMSAHARDSVKKYLGGMTIDAAATWMDDIKTTDEGKKMATWHYVNIEKGKTYDPATTEENVVNEINKAYNNLKHRKNLTPDQVTFNIKVLVHLIGDLQQPLHTGYKSDVGGNAVKVSYNGQTPSLHSLWDSKIIETLHITVADCLAQHAQYKKEQISEISRIDPLAWLKQSRDSLAQVYSFSNNTIDEQYARKAKTVIEKQILCGGLRLAAVMNDVFGK